MLISAADSRLTAFESISDATRFWVKVPSSLYCAPFRSLARRCAGKGPRPILCVWQLRRDDSYSLKDSYLENPREDACEHMAAHGEGAAHHWLRVLNPKP